MQWWKKQESPCFSCGECQERKIDKKNRGLENEVLEIRALDSGGLDGGALVNNATNKSSINNLNKSSIINTYCVSCHPERIHNTYLSYLFYSALPDCLPSAYHLPTICLPFAYHLSPHHLIVYIPLFFAFVEYSI